MTIKHLLAAAVIATGLTAIPSAAFAQDTASGTLTVTATVESSIAMTFENDAAGVSLTGAGTNAATRPSQRSTATPPLLITQRRGRDAFVTVARWSPLALRAKRGHWKSY